VAFGLGDPVDLVLRGPTAHAINCAVNLTDPAWRGHPLRTTLRVINSIIRRRLPALQEMVVPFDEGRSRVVADLRTALGLTLYRYGLMDADMALVGRLLRPGDIFVDGGANVGLFTLIAARAVGSGGQVLAFEPSAKTRDALLRNIALNEYHWVSVRSEALDAEPGERRFVARHGNGAGLSSFAPEAFAPGDEARLVATTSLDEATAPLDRARVALLKLDLEGAELGALRGSVGLLRDAAPDIVIEVEDAHLRRQGASREQVLELLMSLGYRFYQVRRDGRGELALHAPGDPTDRRSGPNLFASKRLDRVERARVSVVA
jgi:FkbM family methyltransferase